MCFICAEPIAHADRTRDHVPPRNLFLPEDRENLITLPAHRACNESFGKDDEYFQLQVSARAYPHPKVRKLWGDLIPGSGPVMRGFHRPQAKGFKKSVLESLKPVDVFTDGGVYVGSGDVMLQDSQRLLRVVNRIARGIYAHRTGKVLPAAWPVKSDLMDPSRVREFLDHLGIRFHSVGNGTFLYDLKHFQSDDRDALVWTVFFESVHFWSYLGSGQVARLGSI